jgi:hypothetical protein
MNRIEKKEQSTALCLDGNEIFLCVLLTQSLCVFVVIKKGQELG